jgi:hypothetical protein
LFVLNNAEIDVALTDVAIVFGLIGGGLAMAPKMSIRRPTERTVVRMSDLVCLCNGTLILRHALLEVFEHRRLAGRMR